MTINESTERATKAATDETLDLWPNTTGNWDVKSIDMGDREELSNDVACTTVSRMAHAAMK